jgi:regulator of sigma E protease
MLLTIGATIVVLGVLIFVHELGHFMAAKAVGIGVPRFSIGLGPATPLSFKRGETEYVISWIPFGGYVKMATAEEPDMGLEGGPEADEFPHDKLFETKPLWARILVISAGVIMNAIFAYIVHAGLLAAYGTAEDPTTNIAAVGAQDLPLNVQGLADVPFGAQIIRINGDTIPSRGAVREKILGPGAGPLRLEFAGGVPPVTVGSEAYVAQEREAIFNALPPLWPAQLLSVVPGTPAAGAGFAAGDIVVGIGADTVRSWWEMQRIVSASAGIPLEVSVLRGDTVVVLPVTPQAQSVTDPLSGETTEVGQLGVHVDSPVRRIRVGLGGAVVGGVEATVSDAGLILFALRELVLGRMSASELGGPVLIGQISGQTARLGLVAFLSFMALFSINLAILNLLPIPVLDGGQLVFLLAEGIRGKPLSMGLRLRLTQFGLVILVGLMLLAMTNDLRRVFGL